MKLQRQNQCPRVDKNSMISLLGENQMEMRISGIEKCILGHQGLQTSVHIQMPHSVEVNACLDNSIED